MFFKKLKLFFLLSNNDVNALRWQAWWWNKSVGGDGVTPVTAKAGGADAITEYCPEAEMV